MPWRPVPAGRAAVADGSVGYGVARLGATVRKLGSGDRLSSGAARRLGSMPDASIDDPAGRVSFRAWACASPSAGAVAAGGRVESMPDEQVGGRVRVCANLKYQLTLRVDTANETPPPPV